MYFQKGLAARLQKLRLFADRKLTGLAFNFERFETSHFGLVRITSALCSTSRPSPPSAILGDLVMNKTLFAAAAGLTAILSTASIAGTNAAKPLSAQTRANLETAMHGEAYANLKYLRYADQAEAAGKPELAKLFRESANIEANEHFDREAQALQLGGANSANLEDAMAGEHYENVTMYINFAKQAEADGDLKVAAMFRQIAADEGTHFEAYKAALAKLSPR